MISIPTTPSWTKPSLTHYLFSSFHVIVNVFLCFLRARAKCSTGCDLALASYYVWERSSNLSYVAQLFGQQSPQILPYNPQLSGHQDDVLVVGTRVRVPFTCDCLDGDFLGHTFTYVMQSDDTYNKIAQFKFANLTDEYWMSRVNVYDPTRIPDGALLNVVVNCTCGDRRVSRDYGLFVTYPLQPGENLSAVAAESGLPVLLLASYNPSAAGGSGLVFVPAKGISSSAITGISVAGITGAGLAAFSIYAVFYRRKKLVETSTPLRASVENYYESGQGSESTLGKASESFAIIPGASRRLSGIAVDKSVEFSYKELATATNGFSLDNVIGRGGFGLVYYAELRGEKTAIKKMDMQASKEFLTELKILTRVNHLNLVRLIGYCIADFLFLVFEFLENGSLSQHLRGSEKASLPWSARVNIALDSARGLEYIHEHTVPVYIHRDVKSANILIDKDFRGKVADFGLSNLTEYGSSSIHTRLVGTFGYMPPEYARYGDVSPKVDVYAFGVVLFELISAKEAVVKTQESANGAKALVALFDDVLSQPNPKEDLRKLVDPRLEDNYPLDSVYKMATLAKACTQDNPQLRPTMRSMVVALMMLSSPDEDWDVGSSYENHAAVNLMSGR